MRSRSRPPPSCHWPPRRSCRSPPWTPSRPPKLRRGRGEAGPERGQAVAGTVALPVRPPPLARGGQGVDRVVVGILPAQRERVAGLHRGPVVLGPVGDAQLAVVPGHLVHPALA